MVRVLQLVSVLVEVSGGIRRGVDLDGKLAGFLPLDLPRCKQTLGIYYHLWTEFSTLFPIGHGRSYSPPPRSHRVGPTPDLGHGQRAPCNTKVR